MVEKGYTTVTGHEPKWIPREFTNDKSPVIALTGTGWEIAIDRNDFRGLWNSPRCFKYDNPLGTYLIKGKPRGKEPWDRSKGGNPKVVNTIDFLNHGGNYGPEAEAKFNERFVSHSTSSQTQWLFQLLRKEFGTVGDHRAFIQEQLRFTLEMIRWVQVRKRWITWAGATYLDSDLPELGLVTCAHCGRATLVDERCCSDNQSYRLLYRLKNGRIINPAWISFLVDKPIQKFDQHQLSRARTVMKEHRWHGFIHDIEFEDPLSDTIFPLIDNLTVASVTRKLWWRRLLFSAAQPMSHPYTIHHAPGYGPIPKALRSSSGLSFLPRDEWMPPELKWLLGTP